MIDVEVRVFNAVKWWVLVTPAGLPARQLGPFESEAGARRAAQDLVEMLEQLRLSRS